MSPTAIPAENPKTPVVVPFRRTLLILGILYLALQFGLGQGILALTTAFLGAVILLTGGLVALLKSRNPVAMNRLLRAGIYAGLGVLSVLTTRFQLAVVHRRAERVAAACSRYRAERGVYPDRLEDLVPAYLPEVPSSNVALMATSFHYSLRAKEPDTLPWLWYHDFPGGPRSSYNFRTGLWTHST